MHKFRYELSFKDTHFITGLRKVGHTVPFRCLSCEGLRTIGYRVTRGAPASGVSRTITPGAQIGFLCIFCAPDFMQTVGLPVLSMEDIGMQVELELPRKYSYFYRRYRTGHVEEEGFQQLKGLFIQCMYAKFVNSIEHFVDRELDFLANVEKGTEWSGWWEKRSGYELRDFFLHLHRGLNEKTDPLVQFLSQRSKGIRIPLPVQAASAVYQVWAGSIQAFKQREES